ncbi:MAG TPA: mannose-1-phosphate guanylyltransferase/mannose-6-phosphate isomerase [Usitatibacter sp.]|nr:mannose-1-phosphate guanylyltransferase/mannose-6-phosphate isomerase [Usitatibacter sp.]
MLLIPTILCGGAGSRLWPVSRALHPKPFMRLADGQSLLQKAFLRGAGLPDAGEMLAVTNGELFFQTRDEFREVNARGAAVSYLLEPAPRGTAAAVAAAALHVERTHGAGTALLVLPADHLVSDMEAFRDAVARALALAARGRLVTFGIRPSSPETGYGYIEAAGSDVLRFVEKPSAEVAREYVGSGRFLWNSGMFCFTAGAILGEMRRHCGDIVAGVERCLERSRTLEIEGARRVELDAESLARVPETSVDYAVMEKSGQVSVVACDIGWSDIGSWAAVAELGAADAMRNRVEGTAVLHDVSGCYIRAEDRVVGAVGVEDLVIVDTADALLVARKDRAQDVRTVYAKLKEQGHEAHRLHRTVHRPWGTYTVIEEGPGFKIKRIEVKPGASLSLQMHRHRSEHWVVVDGTAKVTNGERELVVRSNESTFIPAGHRHRLENATEAPLVIIEVQSGPYLGEDDIVRFDDRYGRLPQASA